MRKYFTLLTLFIAPIVSAQLKKGDWNINTSTNAPMNLKLRTNGPGFKSYDFSFNPGIGYFVADRWEIGGGPVLSLEGSRFKDQLNGYSFRNSSSSVGLNLYTKYYLKKEGRVVPYLSLNGGYLRSSGHSTNYNGIKSSYNINQWQAGAGAGVSWFLSPRVALTGDLNYIGDWGSGAGYNSGIEFKIGFQFFLNKKKNKK
jgi:hypothetical protein